MADKWRIDITHPHVSERGQLAAAWLAADIGVVTGVGRDANGKVVKGAGNTGVVGVVALGEAYPAGKQIDILTHAEVVGGANLGAGAAVAGTSYTISNAGVIAATAAGVSGNLGHTETADRLVIRHRTV